MCSQQCVSSQALLYRGSRESLHTVMPWVAALRTCAHLGRSSPWISPGDHSPYPSVLHALSHSGHLLVKGKKHLALVLKTMKSK